MESLRINLGKSTLSDVFGAVRLDQKNQVQSGIGETRCGLNVQTWGTEMCLILFNITDVFSFFYVTIGKCNVSGTVSLHEKARSQQPNKRTFCNFKFFSENFFQMLLKGDTWSF